MGGPVLRLLLVPLLLAGCASLPDRELPAPDATPEQVVEVFVDAVDDRDRAAVAALASPTFADVVAGSWWDADMADLEVGDAVPRATGGSSAEGYDHAVYVPVQLTLSGGDVSLPDGRTVWGYLLARDAAGRWLVVDDGMG